MNILEKKVYITKHVENDPNYFFGFKLASILLSFSIIIITGMRSPFLNENWLDHDKMFYGRHFRQFDHVTVGAVSNITVNRTSTICVREDKEEGIHVDRETVMDTYNRIRKSENQTSAHSSTFSSTAPVFSNDAHLQETRLKKVDKERTFRRLSRCMFNQITVTHIPFKPGDSGTCIYVCDNSLEKYGCIGMAIANHPDVDGGVIVTPMKEILKSFPVKI